MLRFRLLVATVAALLLTPLTAGAFELMPSFASAPAGWTVDRYAPDGFTNVGTFQGRNDVLGITIGPNGDFTNRPAGYQYTFYNTQGEGYNTSGGAGSTLSSSLYVDPSWASASAGFRRTDMWGVVTDSLNNVVDYPIIGFTNNDHGFVGFRVWNDQTGAWTDLVSSLVNYGGWNDLSIQFTGTNFRYVVNGAPVLDLSADPAASGFSRVLMQGYNCNGDPSITNLTCNGYTAHWSNVQIPEPNSLMLLGAGVLGLVIVRRRRRFA